MRKRAAEMYVDGGNLRRIARHLKVTLRTVALWVTYYSDRFDAYQWLWYHHGRYEVSEGKADTYSVGGGNAELRHYLARLAHRLRCFSRCPYALECALRLFVYCFNRRQLYQQSFPNYPVNVMDFISPPPLAIPFFTNYP